MKKLALLTLPALLSGCMTWSAFGDSLQNLVGDPIDTAINKIGYPNAERTIAGHHIYTWASNATGVLTVPQTSFGTATAYGPAGSATAYGTSTTFAAMPVAYHCEIDLEVDMENRIQAYQFNGNVGGCMRYYRALKK